MAYQKQAEEEMERALFDPPPVPGFFEPPPQPSSSSGSSGSKQPPAVKRMPQPPATPPPPHLMPVVDLTQDLPGEQPGDYEEGADSSGTEAEWPTTTKTGESMKELVLDLIMCRKCHFRSWIRKTGCANLYCI